MPAIDIDRESAHEAAARELAKAIYPRPSLTERLMGWLNELLSRLMRGAAELPGGWFTIVVLGLLVLAALIVGARIARRTMSRRGDSRLFGTGVLSAADHRLQAEHHAAQGDWSTAIRQRVRAIGRQLEEDGLLSPVPGRTADELATDAGALLPQFADDLAAATRAFDEVTYGGRPGAQPRYREIADLDDRLRRYSAAGVPDAVTVR
ncbi:MAG: DUF4129 domain-containing protein [Mycobacterium sp.]